MTVCNIELFCWMIVSKEFARRSAEKPTHHIWLDFPDIVSTYAVNLAAKSCAIPEKDLEAALITIRIESHKIAETLLQCMNQKEECWIPFSKLSPLLTEK